MRKRLKQIYQDLSEGKLTQKEALASIRALKLPRQEKISGILLASPRWEKGTLSMPSSANRVEFSERHIILCELPHAHIKRVEISIPDSRCWSWQPSPLKNVAERFIEVAQACFEFIKKTLSSRPSGNVLVQIVVANQAESALFTALSGLLKTAELENPHITGQVILTTPGISSEELVMRLQADKTRHSDKIIKYEKGTRHVLRLQEVSARLKAPNVVFKDQGVYLITGGLGGLGILFAQEIIKQTSNAKIVLAGWSALISEKKKMLEALSAQRASVEYQPVDITDLDQVKQLIAAIKNEHKQLNGIIHAAGIHIDNFILKKTSEEFRRVLLPKVTGTFNLDQASRDIDLDFMVLFSSVASWVGNSGQADYATANGFMDHFAVYRNSLVETKERKGKTLSINWPLWQEGGMRMDSATQKMLEKTTGLQALSTATGLLTFHHSLELPPGQIMVMDGDYAQMRSGLLENPTKDQQVLPAVKTPANGTDVTGLFEKTQGFIGQQLALQLKIAVHQLDPKAPLEDYGIDSILALSLVSELEGTFGALPKTLFFEYQTIDELTGYFIELYADTLRAILTTKDNGHRRLRPSVGVAKLSPLAASRQITGSRFISQGPERGCVGTNQGDHRHDPIAIVGLSGRYAEAVDIQEYWHNLRDGRDCIVEVPQARWDWRAYYTEDRTKEGHHYSKWGGFIAGVDEFDPRFFNISPREAPFIDPQERLFLQHAWMAVEDAGYTRSSLQIPHADDLAGQVGVYVGLMYSEYQLFGNEASLRGKRMSIGGSYASIANRVSYVLNLHGPSMTLDTMCSSSLTAVHIACQDLKLGRTSLAIAGGVNVSIHPNKYLFLSAGQFISGDGHCQSFGQGGGGYIPGEGVGVVILKRLSEAVREGNHIYGIIKGSALNHGGKTNGYSVPNPKAQTSMISSALAESKTDARHISYIEAHGTGTKLGDPIEIAALSKAFQQHTQEKGFCLIGSAKSNIGHCESAAGIAGLTKVLLQMKYEQIVPSLHSQVLNPYIDFQQTPFVVNQTLRSWDQPVIEGQRVARIAGISSFGAGGANAHLIVEEYVPPSGGNTAVMVVSSDAETMISLSARTADQLKQKAIELLGFIRASPPELRAMGYTLQVGREALEERVGFIVSSLDELAEKLEGYIDGGLAIENFFQGQVKGNKEALSLFSADVDLRQTVDQWIGQKRLSKLLDWWVKGLEVDWNKLYANGKPSLISLPTYPFAKEQYWIDSTAGRMPVVAERTTTVLHPLLHTNESDFHQQRYRSSFNGEEFFLKDHQVAIGNGVGQKMLPAAALLEMARAAVEHASAVQPASGTLELHHIAWGLPAVAKEGTPIDIALFANENNPIDFEIFSQENEQEIVHCRGQAIYPTKPTPVRINIEHLKGQMRQERWEAEQLYPHFSAMGLHYGPAYQGIVSVHKGENQAVAQLHLPTSVETNQNDYVLHPSLLDSALQASVCLVADFNQPAGYPFLPVALASLSVVAAGGKDLYAWVRYAPGSSPDGKTNLLDIDLCDQQGNVGVQLRGLSLQQTGGSASLPMSSEVAVNNSTSPTSITYQPEALPLSGSLEMNTVSTATAKPQAIPLMESQEAETSFENTLTPKPQTIQLSGSSDRAAFKEISTNQKTIPLTSTQELTTNVNGRSNHQNGSTVDRSLPSLTPSKARGPNYTIDQLQEQLRTSLAESLYLSPSEIDIDKSFVDLGLDSIVGVEWIKVINKKYSLEISATKVYDYSTISAFASFLDKELEKTADSSSRQPPDQPVVADILKPIVAEKNTARPLHPFPNLKRGVRAQPVVPSTNVPSATSDKIAIVGMSGRYPQAKNMQQYWDNLAQGKNSITEIPPSRWDIDQYYDPDPTQEGKMYCKWLGMLDDVDRFDPLFFQINPAEAECMDPQHRLFLEESYKAFEDAGYSNARLSNTKCGVYLGIMSNDYNYHLSKSKSSSVNITGNSFAIGAARIAYFLNLKGPAIPIDTACSSSLVAIHMACQGLLNHETDMALAGGVNLYLIPEGYIGMCQAGMLSPQGQCKTFDNSANGFVPGEGVGALVLKRLRDAERDNDTIYGVILASGINQDGKTNGITAPSVNSQIELERDVYARYNIDPETISYVEAHGTGTKLGDPIELEALTTVFREKTSKKNFCALGSVKSNIGHPSGAAGVAGVQKVLLSMQHQTLVPTLNVTKENAIFDFENSPFYISREKQPWNTGGSLRRASVSSFGFSGTNAHVVIEEYPPQATNRHPVSVRTSPAQVIILLSARTAEQLKRRARDLSDFIRKNEPSIDLVNMAYTLQVGRDGMRERLGWVVSSVVQLKEKLESYLAGEPVQDAYQGQGTRDKESPPLFGPGADWQKTVDQGIDEHELPTLLDAWVKGREQDWSRLYGNHQPQRISLPTYPFAKERYWIDLPADTPAVNQEGASETAGKAVQKVEESIQKMHYHPEWKETALAVQSGADKTRVGPILVVDTTDELYRALQEELTGRGKENSLVLVKLENSYQELAPGIFTINPEQEAHFYQLIESLNEKGQLPRQIIHQGLGPEQLDNQERIVQQLNYSFYALFYLCKALIRQKQPMSLQIVSLFSGSAHLPAPQSAALGGFFKTLMLEAPQYSTKVIEIQREVEDSAIAASEKARIVLDELRDSTRSDHEIRYTFQADHLSYRRYIKTLTQFERKISQLPLKHHGVYIVSGGLGGLGLIFSEYLVKNFQCKLVLLGRSALQAEQEEKLNQLKVYHPDILYLQADVSKSEAVEAVVNTAKARFSQINGVIHSAGITKDAFILKKSKEELDQVLAPKIYGALNLDHATREEKLDVFILFSSVAGVLGNVGQCDYAYANHFLDAFAESRGHLTKEQKRYGQTLSINWPYWEEGGMLLIPDEIALAKQQMGLYPLPTKVGIQYWEEFLQSGLSQGIALYGFPSKIKAYVAPPVKIDTDPPAPANPVDPAILLEKAAAYLKTLIGKEIKLAPEWIDPQESFDSFGIDSIVVSRINVTLEKELGALPKTLFYEYSTIEELAGYLTREARPALIQFFDVGNSANESDSHKVEGPAIEIREANQVQHTYEDAEPIAIIGVHGCYPQSEDLNTYWENLKRGKDLTDLVPANRWNYREFYHQDPEKAAEGKVYCKWGGFIHDIDKFDPQFFNIPPEEARVMDPQERLFLKSVWAAIEDAGYTKDRLKKRHPKAKSADVGVFVGVTTNSYNLLAAEEWSRGNSVPSAHPWSIANRVSYFFDFNGPSLPIDTACSSSLVAIHLACESLKKQECQVAIAGGVNLYLHPSKYHAFCKSRMVALGGKCRSYGAGDDGFVPGEGVGSILLKPLSQAVADQDHIYAVIAGSAYDHSGRSNGYSAPNPNAQANLISHTLSKANIDPETIGYVEGHGTGTQLGDSLEIVALTNAFQKQTKKKQFCPVGSVKANMGHSEAAAGIAGVAKILLQLKHRHLVPTIHSEEVNPTIEFKETPFYLQHTLTPWKSSPHYPRRALMNSFGAGGVNACIIVEEYEHPKEREKSKKEGPYLVVLSAKNKERLQECVNRLLTYVGKEKHVNLANLSYTLQVGREAMPERLALVVSNRSELIDRLKDWRQQKPSTTMYQGSLDPRAGKKSMKDNEDTRRTIFESRDLAQLAQRWTAGMEVDWENLYSPDTPVRIALPTYPFAKERYWVTDAVVPEKKKVLDQKNGHLHPLVSYNSSSLREVSFSSWLSDREFYALDHQVNEEKIFPGSGFLEIAGISGNIAGDTKVCKIKDIVWMHPLSFKKGSQWVQTFLRPNGNGTVYQIASLDDENERIIHSEGRLYFQNGKDYAAVSEKSIPIKALKEKCLKPQGGDHFYTLFRKAGFKYGPSFQTIQEFYINGSYALAKLKIADHLRADFDQFILHPSLLDGALQTVVGLLGAADPEMPYLPFAIDEVAIMRPLPQICYAYAEYADPGDQAQKDVKKFNIQLLNEDGVVLIQLKNFYARALEKM